MKIIQKLEIFFGVATLLATLLSFYFIALPHIEQLERLGYPRKGSLLRVFLALILPGFLILVGTYFHAVKQSIIGFIIILVFGGLLTFSHAIGFLVGASFNGHVLLGISPGLFALTTMLLALYSQSLAPPQPEIVKLR